VLANPARVLERLCQALGIEYTDTMLRWPASRGDTDGAWAPAWYDAVEKSTACVAPVEQPQPQLPDHLQRIADAARRDYEALATNRLR